MTDHHPFSVAVTIRGACTDRAALMAAGRASLLRDGTTPELADEIVGSWSAVDALSELISEGLARIISGTDPLPYPGTSLGFDMTEMEPSYSGEGDHGDFPELGDQ